MPPKAEPRTAASPTETARAFRQRYGAEPRLFRAPGRINIIGEHTDYSGGFVLPAAIDRTTFVAARANGSGELRLFAEGFGETSADLAALTPAHDWSDYVIGVADVLARDGVALEGADLLITSEVPVGAGVSSSAAIEVGTARALLALAGREADGTQVALWCQKAENQFVGAPTGIMDQYASANGVADAALLLDCRSLKSEAAPIPPAARFLVVDSMVPHTLVSGEYRRRREECEAAAAQLGVPQLRDVALSDLQAALAHLPQTLARRCRHVVTENARVLEAVEALRADDLPRLGALIDRSHASLKDDFEVSTPEVDRLTEIARAAPGVFGARIMGGGFGGSVIVLVAADAAEGARDAIQQAYGAERGDIPDAFVCRAVEGAGEIRP